MIENKHYFWAVIAFVIAIVLAYILLSLAHDESKGQVQGQIILMLPPSKWDEELDQLDLQAFREAYVAKIRQLFDVYVREGMTTDEPIVKGHATARRAFIRGMQAREKVLELRKGQQK